MNKSKFKSVKFKPLDRFLYEENACFWRDVGMYHDIMFEEKFIENNESLFEVEKAEREFKEGAYYQAALTPLATLEIIQFNGGVFHRMGINSLYTEKEFFAIGERIEL